MFKKVLIFLVASACLINNSEALRCYSCLGLLESNCAAGTGPEMEEIECPTTATACAELVSLFGVGYYRTCGDLSSCDGVTDYCNVCSTDLCNNTPYAP